MKNKLLKIMMYYLILSTTNILADTGFMLTPYASLRLQAESVSVDQAIAGQDTSYKGLRDAYSRIGIKASSVLQNGTLLSATIEFPVNFAELKVEDPSFFEGFYKDNDDPRLYNISITNDEFGSLQLGKQWLTYYNHIAYPVDYFSSFYSGFATHATFRREALTYTTPVFSGLAVSISGVDLTDGSGTDYLDTMQYAASYNKNALSVALAYQDTVGNRANLIGLSASYTAKPWRFATKVEQLRSNNTVTMNKDPVIFNVYGSYTKDKFTFKAMYANGDGSAGNNDEADAFFIGDSYQFGIDYQYNDELLIFTEYFYEGNGYAIYTPNSKSFSPLAGYQVNTDGQAVVIGARYDF